MKYFAYGSNMAGPVMDGACAEHQFLGPARLPGYRFAFMRRSVRTDTGVADILPDPSGSVWGALYELERERLGELDGKEALGSAYERLISDVVSLRRAERTSSAREDIASVRANLERIAGPTVTRAMGARLLGVSQTALDRWVASGDVPLLVTPTGHRELPLHWLVESIEAVRERRQAYPDDRHPLGAVLRARRSEAQRLSPSALLGRADRHDGSGDGAHRRAELRSLAYHRAVAQRLDEGIVRNAQDRLARWMSQARINPHYAQQWQTILANPPAEIAHRIGEDTPRMRDLRQSSPFAGTLSEPARLRALAVVDEMTCSVAP